MDAEDRFGLALAKRANDKLHEEGDMFLGSNEIDEIRRELDVNETAARHVLRQLDDNFLLTSENGHLYKGQVALALRYEEEHDRPLFWKRSVRRREVLRRAAESFERDEVELDYNDSERFVDAPYGEAVAAAQVLEYLGLIEFHLFMGRSFSVSIEAAGYNLIRDEVELHRQLPTSASEDEEAHAVVVPDVLGALITSVDDLLQGRGWEGARRELGRGDDQYEDRHWVDAVGEYYSAIESGLKHRMDEAGVTYGAKAALRDLAKEAAKADVIPRNYQELFSFADSIRSPRRHGAGGNVEEVEVGPAEALLMGNLARSLLLYLGHRPQRPTGHSRPSSLSSPTQT